MNLYDALQQALPQYDIVPLTDANFADISRVFETNQDFLVEGYGGLIDEKGIFGAISQLVDDFKPSNKYLAGIYQNGKPIAAIDLLANSPAKGDLYLSFLVVRRDLQGQGIGTAISCGIISAAELAGFNQIHLGSFDNTAKFWQNQGYIRIERHNDFIAFHRSLT